ncbi:MAG: hypothetical protein GY839_19545 [candidate division Zixibacteria bacterium]|nr:hypothetical protein [candidate division Zixibacteria bacterium]
MRILNLIKRHFIAQGVINSLSRLLAITLSLAAIDQLLTRFGIDLLSILSADLGHFIMICTIIMLIAELWLVDERKPVTEVRIPSHDFARSVLMYASYLKSVQKNKSVVQLRNKLTHLFHLLGLHSSREQLGKITIGSAAILNDNLSKGEILIDDLGWAIHLQGRSHEAAGNISKAIALLSDMEVTEEENIVRCNLALAKAYRHLAFLSPNAEMQKEHLAHCDSIISELSKNVALMKGFGQRITCDQAQVHHARGFLIAKNIGLHLSGTVPSNDTITRDKATQALAETKIAIRLFKQVGDLEREAKTLVLVERLLSALHEDIEALEAKARREKIMSSSGFEGSISTIALAQAKNA